MTGKVVRRSGMVALVVIALAACPLPFEFVPTGTTGVGIPSNDPANPQVTSAPVLVITEITSGNPVTAVGSPFTVVRNVRILLESDTPGATVLYATDGSDPIPGLSGTKVFNQSSPIILDAHGESAAVKAIAIGPNMYPSLLTDQTIALSYQQAAAPTFTPGAGNFSTDQSVTMASSTPGATIYYTVVDGTGPAPTPQPGQPGTLTYTGPVAVSGAGTAKSISAIAAKGEMLDSTISSAVFTIGYNQVAAPVFSPPPGASDTDIAVTLTTATPGATIYYTIVTGGGPAPTPVPGQPGTQAYSGPITISGIGTIRSISAIAVANQMLDSPVSTGIFAVGDSVLHLDGAGDYVNVPAVAYDFSGGLTIELNLNVTTHAGNVHYVSLGNGGFLLLDLGNYGGAGDVNTWADGLDPIDAGYPVLINAGMLADTWYHLAFTYDGTNQIIYLDGNVVATVPTTGTLNQVITDYVLTIGARYTGDTQFVSGMLDEVRIWSDARTQSEIQATMNGILSGGEAGLVGYWNFDDGSATDLTGNGANGVLVNDAYIGVDAPTP